MGTRRLILEASTQKSDDRPSTDVTSMKSTCRAYPWLALAAVLGSQIALLVAIVVFWTLFPKFGYWATGRLGTFSLTAAAGIAAFLVVVAFAQPKSLRGFLDTFDIASLHQGISRYSVASGGILGLIGVLLTSIGGPQLSERLLTRPFVHQPGPGKYLLTILLLVGPIFEEITMRGFLYRAFRSRYGISFSILTIVAVSAITHWGVTTRSLSISLLLAVLHVILCLLLEMTRNLWDCIICHILYNAVLITAWSIGAGSPLRG